MVPLLPVAFEPDPLTHPKAAARRFEDARFFWAYCRSGAWERLAVMRVKPLRLTDALVLQSPKEFTKNPRRFLSPRRRS